MHLENSTSLGEFPQYIISGEEEACINLGYVNGFTLHEGGLLLFVRPEFFRIWVSMEFEHHY